MHLTISICLERAACTKAVNEDRYSSSTSTKCRHGHMTAVEVHSMVGESEHDDLRDIILFSACLCMLRPLRGSFFNASHKVHLSSSKFFTLVLFACDSEAILVISLPFGDWLLCSHDLAVEHHMFNLFLMTCVSLSRFHV